jgi:tRNA pseudouridine38-40 synthase
MRIAMGVEYDGSGFCGWQTQPAGCAVQDRLETALAQIAGVAVATICAGRTDAGVHALAQVVHFDCTVGRPESAWVRGVNALLPPAVAVTWMTPVPESFSARFSATARHYRYVLLNHPVRPAADHGRVGWFHALLDVERMRAAAVCLLGEHDFSAFRSSQCQAKSPVRTLKQLDINSRGPYVPTDFCITWYAISLAAWFMWVVGGRKHCGRTNCWRPATALLQRRRLMPRGCISPAWITMPCGICRSKRG